MLRYNDLENECNILFDYKNRSVFNTDGGNRGGNDNGKRDDVFDILKKYFVMIFFFVNISIAGILCILVGRTEFSIFLGFVFFACVFPVSAASQFIANKIVFLFRKLKDKK